jgi:hypothetical protein
MKKTKLSFAISSLMLLSISLMISCSDGSSSSSSKDAAVSDVQNSSDSGWVSLFNGKDLSGWELIEGTATYTVEDGEIVGATVPKNPNGVLCTKDTFANFILEMDVKVDTALNSGIQIRSHTKNVNGNKEVYGYQIEVDPSSRAWSAGIYDSRRRGWLVDLKDKPDAQKAFKNEEWNHYKIYANADTIKTWLNDVPVATLVDSLDSNGFIGLQVHQSASDQSLKVRFKDIKIKVLK